MDLMKGGLVALSALYLANTASKEDLRKVVTNRKLAHGGIGLLAGVTLGDKVENLFREGPSTDILKLGAGGTIGVIATKFLMSGGDEKIKDYLGLKASPKGYQNE